MELVSLLLILVTSHNGPETFSLKELLKRLLSKDHRNASVSVIIKNGLIGLFISHGVSP